MNVDPVCVFMDGGDRWVSDCSRCRGGLDAIHAIRPARRFRLPARSFEKIPFAQTDSPAHLLPSPQIPRSTLNAKLDE